MDLNLSGKIAVISGSTLGIGFAAALGLAKCGAHVIVNGRTQERVDEALARLRTAHPAATASGYAGDLATQEAVNGLVAAHPIVDIVVNNLGIFAPTPFEEIKDEDWLLFFQTNVMSGVRLSRAYIPSMRARNWGRIIFVSSESGVNVAPEMIHYSTTKTAQLVISRGLAETLAGTNITVNSVLPGPTLTEGVEGFLNSLAEQGNISREQVEKEFFIKQRPSSIISRFLTAEEVANPIVYLCSPAASGTTGAAVRVEGGLVRSII